MPGIVVIGTQWGDEGKGKATDQLGELVDYTVRYSGGNNRPHNRGRRGEVRAASAAVRDPQPWDPVIGNGVVVDLSVLFREIDMLNPAVWHLRPDHLGQRARDRALPPGHGQGDRAVPGQEEDRYHRTRRRPAYADKINRIGIRSPT